MRHEFSKDMLIKAGQTSPEDALATAEYPASASFIDVTGYEWVNVIVHLGAINASDTPTFKIQQSDSISGTMDTIDTVNCKKVAAHTDDDQVLAFYLETANLATDHHFITCDVSGVANASYADIMFYLGGTRHKPVTQATALIPSDNQFTFAG
uniref:Uncharacterized protein n=1 Tax=viral metagenome TaxID=1070528 RepID=A0A6M3KPN4_9ZZZZ